MDQIEEMLEYFPAMPSPMPSSQPEYPEGSDLLPENTVPPESSVGAAVRRKWAEEKQQNSGRPGGGSQLGTTIAPSRI